MELINILIRTSNRPELFKRCLKSVVTQSYPNIRIIVSYDRPVNYIPFGLESIFVSADIHLPYFYDCYCNDLKNRVESGYFMFLDDDDYLLPDVLSELVLDAPALLYQYKRGDNLYPTNEHLRRGQVGMPCLLLHHSMKNAADIPGTGQGDYEWISKINHICPVKFTPKVIVESDRRGLGKCS